MPNKRTGTKPPSHALRDFKRLKPLSWHAYANDRLADTMAHILSELGRVGLRIDQIETYSNHRYSQSVLSDLLRWMSEQPGEAYARLTDWQALDLMRMVERCRLDHRAKPRIEVSATITKMNNLSVRWHPRGWRDSVFIWEPGRGSIRGDISQRRWKEPPDFQWFIGDEEPTFDSRPSNELMFIRGVGNLDPKPVEEYGPYARYNRDVVDSLLISAVRAAYEGLIRQLEYSFEVEVLDAFDFTLRDEIDDDVVHQHFPIHRVVAWTLEDAAALQQRRAQEKRAAADARNRDELADIKNRHGFTLDILTAVLDQASQGGGRRHPPSSETVLKKTAKILQAKGHTVGVGALRRLCDIVRRQMQDALPPALRTTGNAGQEITAKTPPNSTG